MLNDLLSGVLVAGTTRRVAMTAAAFAPKVVGISKAIHLAAPKQVLAGTPPFTLCERFARVYAGATT